MFVDTNDRILRKQAATRTNETTEEVVTVRIDRCDLVSDVEIIRFTPNLRDGEMARSRIDWHCGHTHLLQADDIIVRILTDQMGDQCFEPLTNELGDVMNAPDIQRENAQLHAGSSTMNGKSMSIFDDTAA